LRPKHWSQFPDEPHFPESAKSEPRSVAGPLVEYKSAGTAESLVVPQAEIDVPNANDGYPLGETQRDEPRSVLHHQTPSVPPQSASGLAHYGVARGIFLFLRRQGLCSCPNRKQIPCSEI
jgi:hypothetical protein